MDQWVYLNGAYVSAAHAAISPFDRGFLFADGVYEVVRYYNGKPLAMAEHLERLAFSLAELKLTPPPPVEQFAEISDRLVERNAAPDAGVYWQVTRGAARRTHAFPTDAKPTVFAACEPAPPLSDGDAVEPLTAISHEETRWARCAIKSVALLPNVLARQAAEEAGCDEAIFVRDDGTVTEGAARSILVVRDGVIETHPLDGRILGSITRMIVLRLAEQLSLPVREQAVTLEQMLGADEVIAVGTTTEVRPIRSIDGKLIGGGAVGPVTRALVAAYRQHVKQACG